MWCFPNLLSKVGYQSLWTHGSRYYRRYHGSARNRTNEGAIARGGTWIATLTSQCRDSKILGMAGELQDGEVEASCDGMMYWQISITYIEIP